MLDGRPREFRAALVRMAVEVSLGVARQGTLARRPGRPLNGVVWRR